MKKMNKSEEIEFLKGEFNALNSCFLIDYRGLTVEQITALRRQLKQKDATVKIVKNTLAEKASAGTVFENLTPHLKGPTSMVFPRGEVIDVAKAIVKLEKDFKAMEIRVGFLEGKVLTKEQVVSLSELPPKEIMLATLLGTMKAPVQNFVGGLNQVIAKFVRVVKAIEEQKTNG